MSIENWPAWPTDVECRETDGPWARHMMQCYSSRLRDTAAALQELVASGVEYDAGKYLVVQVPHAAMDEARALLAQLKTEGLV